MKIDRRIIIILAFIITGYFLFKKVFAKNSNHTDETVTVGGDIPTNYI